MKTMFILDYEVNVHNEREKKLVDYINFIINLCHSYIDNKTFGNDTYNIVESDLLEICGLFNAFNFLSCFPDFVAPFEFRRRLESEFGMYLI